MGLASVLDASARMNLGAGFSAAVRERIPILLAVIRDTQTPRIRVQAARVLAYISLRDWNRDVAREVLQLLDTLELDQLDEDAVGELALTRGLLLYLAGETSRSRREVDATILDFQRRGTANLVAVQLLVGLGTLRAREGAYDEAVGDYQRALEMAAKLGNDTMVATVMGNLGVCLGRLGLYEEQAHVSSTAPQPWGAEFGGFIEIQLAYCQALSHAMRGSRGKVVEIMEELEQRMWGTLPAWMVQAWKLWKADLHFLAGNVTLAQVASAEAIQAHDYALLSPGFAGPFARWLEKLASDAPARQRASICIDRMLADVRQYDALDYAQVLGVSLLLEPEGDNAGSRHIKLNQILAKLPAAAVEQLRRLQALPPV
jgi:tetratricopeptide (TPR) repeat protein